MRFANSVEGYLAEHHVPFHRVHHRIAFTAQTEAAAAHIPGRQWAKTVVCFADGKPVLAVVPAPYSVDIERLRVLSGAKALRVGREDEFAGLYPGCEPGAMPPFGAMYGQPVFVDERLAMEPEIVFNAGTHSDAIRMSYSDFAALSSPTVGRFGRR
jgi:Ala-tRNA(Pro) deacylase